ncbi:MAG: FAD-dependent 5-carboxymethylaminomethyl-2-thiouridine(34) oxidoreductase MnmC, partial [Methylophilus sp.]|nr:FAD-dependent 5-carboxymethylaminomethyl-2-thiouridine(34) oxidoreductase MnmC [Methylophilus sp.]
ADAWFLDGFAPSKNPEMWQSPLFDCMARCSRPGTTFSTFTSAGFVRRGLQGAGFHVKKKTGYGAKREMLSGEWQSAANGQPAVLPKVAVIGAGIAGCSSAWFLASLGCEVHVFERADKIANGASGNPRGMLYPRLNAEKPMNDQLALRSYSFSLRHYADLGLNPDAFKTCGLLQLGGNAREKKRVDKVSARYDQLGLLKPVDAAQATTLAGVTLTSDCLYFADAAWVNPSEACQAMLAHENIQVRLQQEIHSLSRQEASWQLITATQTHAGFDAVIVANAAEAGKLLPDSGMWLNPVRGQMGMVATQAALLPLKTILCGEGYLTPLHNGMHAMGATFAAADVDTSLREEDNQSNLSMIRRLSPQFDQAGSAEVTYARAASRCGSPDYLPYVGPLLPTSSLAACASPEFAELPVSKGLYVHVAHGSKGLMTAPYCAAVLARRLLRDFALPLPQLTEDSFWAGLHPQRHLFKQLGWKHLLNPFNDPMPS